MKISGMCEAGRFKSRSTHPNAFRIQTRYDEIWNVFAIPRFDTSLEIIEKCREAEFSKVKSLKRSEKLSNVEYSEVHYREGRGTSLYGKGL